MSDSNYEGGNRGGFITRTVDFCYDVADYVRMMDKKEFAVKNLVSGAVFFIPGLIGGLIIGEGPAAAYALGMTVTADLIGATRFGRHLEEVLEDDVGTFTGVTLGFTAGCGIRRMLS
ncbi:hypothetical protein ACFL2V_14815 [Pseudomonadota bacterium]